MASAAFDSLTRDMVNGAVAPATDALYAMLVNGAAPDFRAATKRSDIATEVANGNGYATGGKALTGVTATLDNTAGNDKTTLKAAELTWAASTITATGLVIYKRRGGASTADELVAYVDFGGTFTSTNGNFSTTTLSTTGFLVVAKG